MKLPVKVYRPAASPAEAILGGHFAQVRFLLELIGGANDPDPITGRSPLILCALIEDTSWSISLARLLLEKGAKVGMKDRKGMNALHYACAYRRLELTQLFLKAIDYYLNSIDRHRHTALFYAVHYGCYPICEILINTLAHFNLSVSVPNKEGITPLMEAWKCGHFDIAAILIESGADTELVDHFGRSTHQYEEDAVQQRRCEEDMYLEKASGRRLRYDDVIEWQKHRQRARSAPAMPRFKSFKQQLAEKRQSKLYQCSNHDVIKVASPLDLRNKPTEVFKTEPKDFFNPATSSRSTRLFQENSPTVNTNRSRFSLTNMRKLLSTDEIASNAENSNDKDTDSLDSESFRNDQVFYDEQQDTADGRRINENVANSQETKRMMFSRPKSAAVSKIHSTELPNQLKSKTVLRPSTAALNVKRDIPVLFHSYEFQCSKGYRQAAKQPKDYSEYVTSMDQYTAAKTGQSVLLMAAEGESSDTGTSKGKKDRRDKKSRVSRLTAAAGLLGQTDSGKRKGGGRLSRASFVKDDS